MIGGRRFFILPLKKPLRERIGLMNDSDMIISWEKREEFILKDGQNLWLTNDTGPC